MHPLGNAFAMNQPMKDVPSLDNCVPLTLDCIVKKNHVYQPVRVITPVHSQRYLPIMRLMEMPHQMDVWWVRYVECHVPWPMGGLPALLRNWNGIVERDMYVLMEMRMV
jgi:hypothetical protein